MASKEKINPDYREFFNSEVVKEHSLILHNDEVNTFEHVIECLIDVCRHTTEQAEQCAYITHYNGKCDVKNGEFEELSHMKGKLTGKGLSVTIK